jgi:hypothetical protein
MRLKIILSLFVATFLVLIFSAKTATAVNDLRGRILLQVEAKGEAWYVNPGDGERYYLADGDAAYNQLSQLGVGITNKDLVNLENHKSLALQQAGKIFLQIESKGEAYYVDFSGNLHYLKNGAAAYNLLRSLGLGITNNDLKNITIGYISTSAAAPATSAELIPPAASTVQISQKNIEALVEDEYTKNDITLYLALVNGSERSYYVVNKFTKTFLYLGNDTAGWANYFYYINHHILTKKVDPTSYYYLTINLRQVNASYDNDQDGLPNEAEFIFNTNENSADSDGDSYADGAELMRGFDPTKAGVNFTVYQEPDVTAADRSLLASQYKYDLEGKSNKIINDITQIQTSVEMYYFKNDFYPQNLSFIPGLEAYYKQINYSPEPEISAALQYAATNPKSPVMDTKICPNYKGYTYKTINNQSSFELDYCLDIPLKSKGIKAGFNQASPAGLFKE